MQLEHTFTVPAAIDQAWQVLLDIERVAPCMPGAAIDSVDGDDFTGTVKVRLGPIGLTYKGKASFVEKNEAEHRAVIDAQGKDARGNGTANAKVTATLVAEGPDTTSVTVLTDLNITGKPAQFGRGVMLDVGNKLIGQFADCLAGKLSGPSGGDAESPAPAGPATIADAAAPSEQPPPQTAPLEEASSGGAPVAGAPLAGAPVAGAPSPEAALAGAPLAGAAAEQATPTEQATPAAAEQAETAELVEGAEAAAESSAPGTPSSAAEPSALGTPPSAAEPSAPGISSSASAEAPAADPRPAPSPPATTPRPAAQGGPAHEVEPIDLLGSAGPAVAKRLAPVLAAVVLVVYVVLRRRRS